MLLTRLHLKNFKRFKDDVKIDLEVTNKDQNIVLIEALNWVGKTSILQAIQWTFFWLDNSAFQKFLNYEARKDGDYVMGLALEYYDNDFNPCVVSRTYEWNGKDQAPHSVLEFSIAWVRQEMNDELWEEYLNKNFPREISNFFFFDGERLQYLMDPKDPKKVKSAIEKVLGIETIRNLRNSLIDLKSNALREIQSINADKKIQIKEMQLSEQEALKNRSLEEIKALNENYEDTEKRRRVIDEKLLALAKRGLTKEKIIERNTLLSSLSEKEIGMAKINSILEDFKSSYIDKFLLMPFADLVIEQLEIQDNNKKERVYSEFDHSSMERIISALYDPVCIVWGESLTPEKKEIVMESLKKAFKSNDRDITEVGSSVDLDLNSRERSLMQWFFHEIKKWNDLKIADLIDQKITLSNSRDSIQRRIEDLDREIDVPVSEWIDELHQESTHLSQELSRIEIKIRTTEDAVNKANSEIQRLQRGIEEWMLLSSGVEAKKKYLDMLNRLNAVFDSYIASLVANTKKRLETKAFEMFSLIVNSNIYSKIEITDDFEVLLIDKSGNYQDALNSWHVQILMTSMLWGLEQLSDDFKLPIVIDTPLARLDPIHRKNMLEKYFSSAGSQVIILSQPSEITEIDRKNPEFSSHLKDGNYIRLNFDEEDMQTHVEYVHS